MGFLRQAATSLLLSWKSKIALRYFGEFLARLYKVRKVSCLLPPQKKLFFPHLFAIQLLLWEPFVRSGYRARIFLSRFLQHSQHYIIVANLSTAAKDFRHTIIITDSTVPDHTPSQSLAIFSSLYLQTRPIKLVSASTGSLLPTSKTMSKGNRRIRGRPSYLQRQ